MTPEADLSNGDGIEHVLLEEMGSVFLSDTDEGTRRESSRGFVYRRDQPNVEIERVELQTEFGGRDDSQKHITARFHAENGEVFDVEGHAVSVVPCRNRRGGGVTRIAEGMTQWTCGDHRGFGMTEYLDQIVKAG